MSNHPPSARLDYPATHRNGEAIAAVLAEVLPARGTVLEVASGSGQHTAMLAPRFPSLVFQPSDREPELLESCAAWSAELPNVADPIHLDVREPWSVGHVDAILCINMIHIAPWACTEALFRGAAGCLAAGGPVYLYGPFRVDGAHTAPSNEAFDHTLRGCDPAWGVRDREAVVDCASAAGFELERAVAMPANNQSLVFRLRRSPDHAS